ncbi:MAG: phosphocholine cytidylyltransferase family protein [Gammaproteobacteria bacterium]|nr:phosphocholine cytidylyltransferase family protein [Gammaproteobacteria bacterium]
MKTIKAIILLAGLGSRLGRPHPKSLVRLGDGHTILSRQLTVFNEFGIPVYAVVGFKKELIMEAAPNLMYVYNPNYDTTNTSKSLLCGLRHIENNDVLWINGDVVFDPEILRKMLSFNESAVAVNQSKVGEEEVKYRLNKDGYIEELSKQVQDAAGEALGINFIKADLVPELCSKLAEVDDDAYFERAMELLIAERGNIFRPVDVGALPCIEVDFDEDLRRAEELFNNKR